MKMPTLYDFMKDLATSGYTETDFYLFPQKERELLNGGFGVQRIRTAVNNPKKHFCRVSWAHASEGTVARKFLDLAIAADPELFKQVSKMKQEAYDEKNHPYLTHNGHAIGYPGLEGK